MKSLERLRQKKAAIEARIQSAEARFKSAERKKDTRRKILVGSYFIDKARDEKTWDALQSAMDNYLTRPTDRTLFDLPPDLIKNKSKT